MRPAATMPSMRYAQFTPWLLETWRDARIGDGRGEEDEHNAHINSVDHVDNSSRTGCAASMLGSNVRQNKGAMPA
jgi:hypothetical protein